jgi:hypothetical protein
MRNSISDCGRILWLAGPGSHEPFFKEIKIDAGLNHFFQIQSWFKPAARINDGHGPSYRSTYLPADFASGELASVNVDVGIPGSDFIHQIVEGCAGQRTY